MHDRRSKRLVRTNVGFLLAKATQRWNEMLYQRFCEAGFSHVRPSFGSILVPLFEDNGLRLGELAERGGISKQTMTTMVRHVEEAGLVRRTPDPEDARAVRIYLTREARRFEPVAERALSELDALVEAAGDAKDVERVRRWLRKFAGI